MPNQQTLHVHSLDKFHLSFEHDRTWGEAKKIVRTKTVKPTADRN